MATVGFFDGVHVGHRHLIEQVKRGTTQGTSSVVITFPVHPRRCYSRIIAPYYSMSLRRRCRCWHPLALITVSTCLFEALSRLSAEEFMRRVLKQTLQVDTLFVGYDRRFGRDREEGAEQYARHGQVMGRIVLATRFPLDEERNVSSSLIRSLLQSGNIKMPTGCFRIVTPSPGRLFRATEWGAPSVFPPRIFSYGNLIRWYLPRAFTPFGFS